MTKADCYLKLACERCEEYAVKHRCDNRLSCPIYALYCMASDEEQTKIVYDNNVWEIKAAPKPENDMTIQEDYCSHEVRKLLKAKGFPTGVGSWSKGFIHYGDGYVGGLVKHEDSITHQMAMKWLREEHHIHIMISIGFDEDKMFYHPNFAQFEKDRITYGDPIVDDFSTNEEAVEAALKYSLENLI